ncbi:glycine cleavage system H protein [Ostertagia ostertagi]
MPVRAFSVTPSIFAERKYTKKHEWVSVEGELGTVGITDFAAEQLGDIVFVELPEKDAKNSVKGESTGAVESVKAASDIYAPVSGTVTEKNEVLEQEPGKINKSPFGDGWLYKLKLSNKSELADLLSEKDYQEFKKEDEGHE